MSLIRHQDFIRQVVDFSGLRFGKKYPSDIDGIMDFGGELFVIMETKHHAAKLPPGQRYLFEAVTDTLGLVKPAYTFVTAHNSSGVIDLSSTIVTEIRHGNRWYPPKREIDLLSAVKYVQDKHL